MRDRKAHYDLTGRIGSGPEGVVEALDHEIMAEKAATLGRAVKRMQASLQALAAEPGAERATMLKAAAQAVQACLIQRELCGLRDHHDFIREHEVPRRVMARLGAD